MIHTTNTAKYPVTKFSHSDSFVMSCNNTGVWQINRQQKEIRTDVVYGIYQSVNQSIYQANSHRNMLCFIIISEHNKAIGHRVFVLVSHRKSQRNSTVPRGQAVCDAVTVQCPLASPCVGRTSTGLHPTQPEINFKHPKYVEYKII